MDDSLHFLLTPSWHIQYTVRNFSLYKICNKMLLSRTLYVAGLYTGDDELRTLYVVNQWSTTF